MSPSEYHAGVIHGETQRSAKHLLNDVHAGSNSYSLLDRNNPTSTRI